jgi:hypothetical protein
MILKLQANLLKQKLKGAADDMDPIAYNGMYHPSDVEAIIDSLTIADSDTQKLRQLRAMITYQLGEVEQEGNSSEKPR